MGIDSDNDIGRINNINDVDSALCRGYNTPATESASAAIDRVLTIQEVFELLNVKETYIYWLTHQKKIPHIKMQRHLKKASHR